MEFQNQIEELENQLNQLPVGPERIALREQIIQLADTQVQDAVQFRSRLSYIQDLSDVGGAPEKIVAVFPWLLASLEKNPRSFFERFQVLWYYKWVLGYLPKFPHISRSMIESALEDLRSKFKEHGSSDFMYHKLYRGYCVETGDFEQARVHQAWLLENTEDTGFLSLSDCKACILTAETHFALIVEKNLEKALEIAQPILSGKETCRTVPLSTYNDLIMPLFRAGRTEEAADFIKKSLQKLKTTKGDKITYIGVFINYLAQTAQFSKSLKLLGEYLPLIFKGKDALTQFYFYLHTQAALNQYLQKNEKPNISLKLPDGFPLKNKTGAYEVVALRNWMAEEVGKLEAAFNARNGNVYFSMLKSEILDGNSNTD